MPWRLWCDTRFTHLHTLWVRSKSEKRDCMHTNLPEGKAESSLLACRFSLSLWHVVLRLSLNVRFCWPWRMCKHILLLVVKSALHFVCFHTRIDSLSQKCLYYNFEEMWQGLNTHRVPVKSLDTHTHSFECVCVSNLLTGSVLTNFFLSVKAELSFQGWHMTEIPCSSVVHCCKSCCCFFSFDLNALWHWRKNRIGKKNKRYIKTNLK